MLLRNFTDTPFLSKTIRNADRIAVVERGRISEIGSHAELIAKPGGHYQRLCALQDLSSTQSTEDAQGAPSVDKSKKEADEEEEEEKEDKTEEVQGIGKEEEKELASKASLFGKQDIVYFVIGGIGALLTGIMVSLKCW